MAHLLWCPAEGSRPMGTAPRPHPSPSFFWNSTHLPELRGLNSSREFSGACWALGTHSHHAAPGGPGVATLQGGECFLPCGVSGPLGIRWELETPHPCPTEEHGYCAVSCWLVTWERREFAGGLNPHGVSLVPLFSETQQGPTFLVVRQLASGCCKGSTFPFAEKRETFE